MNDVHIQPAAGWDEESVPNQVGRLYWMWLAGERCVWTFRVDGLRDLAADWNEAGLIPITHWQYADILTEV
jgi:hypothetical protein